MKEKIKKFLLKMKEFLPLLCAIGCVCTMILGLFLFTRCDSNKTISASAETLPTGTYTANLSNINWLGSEVDLVLDFDGYNDNEVEIRPGIVNISGDIFKFVSGENIWFSFDTVVDFESVYYWQEISTDFYAYYKPIYAFGDEESGYEIIEGERVDFSLIDCYVDENVSMTWFSFNFASLNESEYDIENLSYVEVCLLDYYTATGVYTFEDLCLTIGEVAPPEPVTVTVGDDNVYAAGYNSGYSAGYDAGESKGYHNGYEDGFDYGNLTAESKFEEGYNKGYEDGYQESAGISYDLGYQEGHKDGYGQAKEELYDEIENEVLNDKDVFLDSLFSIVDAPLRVLREVFNFEIFGINVADLVFFLLTGVIVIFVIKKVKGD